MQFFSRSHKVPVGPASLLVHLDSRFGREGDYRAETRAVGEHFHTQHELFFICGQLDIYVEGKPLSFSSGVFCIPPFVHHRILLREEVYTMRITAPDGKAVPPLLDAPGMLSLSEFAVSLLPRLALANHKASEAAEREAEALLFLLFLDLYEENVSRPGMIKTARVDDYCAIIDHYIHVRYSEPITLKTLAEALHLSTKQVSRIISSRYHATLSELLNEKRLTVAAGLLTSSELSVSAIAMRVFGRSENYFYRLFRERYGTSPLSYRRAARGNGSQKPSRSHPPGTE